MTLFYLEIQNLKRPHLLGLLRENLVRECTRGWMESGQPRWEKREGNQSTFWVPSSDPAFGAVWGFPIFSLYPQPKSISENVFLLTSLSRRCLSPACLLLSLEALPLCYKQHAGLSGMWFLVSLSWAPLEEKKLTVSVFCMCPALTPVPGT